MKLVKSLTQIVKVWYWGDSDFAYPHHIRDDKELTCYKTADLSVRVCDVGSAANTHGTWYLVG